MTSSPNIRSDQFQPRAVLFFQYSYSAYLCIYTIITSIQEEKIEDTAAIKLFGQRLKQKRKERGLTREKLVDQMDKLASEGSQGWKAPDVSTVARWERGEQCPRVVPHLWLVCQVLQVSPEELGYPKPIKYWPGDHP